MEDPPLRADMPALEATRYMNTGASGPSPRQVVSAAADWFASHAFDAPGEDGMYPAAHESFDRSRSAIADLIGADDDEIALTNSTVDGITRFAAAVEWGSDDVIVRTDMEHPAGILQWRHLANTTGATVRELANDRGRLDLDAYVDAVADATVVCLSAVTWNYGTTLPVSELVSIAHDAGALVLIDGVQAVGQRPVDVKAWGADAVAAAGHKWLLGPWGGGFLYVDAAVAEGMEPGSVGYWGVEEPTADDLTFKPAARRFELGTRSPAPHEGVRAAIELLEGVGMDRIQRRIETLTDRLKEAVPGDRLVSPRDYESGLVTVRVDDPESTVARLRDAGVIIRALPDGRTVRASIHVFNTPADVDALLSGFGWPS